MWKLKQVDAWSNPEEGSWNYNDSWTVGETRNENPEEDLFDLIRPEYRKDYYTEDIGTDPDCVELRERKTDRPVFCAELHDEITTSVEEIISECQKEAPKALFTKSAAAEKANQIIELANDDELKELNLSISIEDFDETDSVLPAELIDDVQYIGWEEIENTILDKETKAQR